MECMAWLTTPGTGFVVQMPQTKAFYARCKVWRLCLWWNIAAPKYRFIYIKQSNSQSNSQKTLIHWGRVTHICIGNLTIIGSDYGLSPGRRQAIIWTNDGILLNGPLGTNFSEILIEINTFSFKKMPLKMSSGKWQPFCFSLNVLMLWFVSPVMKSHRKHFMITW